MAADETMRQAAQANDKANFGHVFVPAFEDALVDHHAENGDFVNMVFQDKRLRDALGALMMDKVYGRLTRAESPPA